MVGFTFKSHNNSEKLAEMRFPSGLPLLSDATGPLQSGVMQTAWAGPEGISGGWNSQGDFLSVRIKTGIPAQWEEQGTWAFTVWNPASDGDGAAGTESVLWMAQLPRCSVDLCFLHGGVLLLTTLSKD